MGWSDLPVLAREFSFSVSKTVRHHGRRERKGGAFQGHESSNAPRSRKRKGNGLSPLSSAPVNAALPAFLELLQHPVCH